MTEVNGNNGNFDFKKYDVGGTDATANDGKLTGKEAQNARADGWTVWDGYSEANEAPKNVNQNENTTDDNAVVPKNLSEAMKKLKELPQWAIDLIRGGQDIPQDTAPKHDIPIDSLPPSVKELTEGDLDKVMDKIRESIKKGREVKVNGKPMSDVVADLTGKNDDKLTAEQKEARAELNQKQSSIGMTYADAKAKVAEILQKYPECYDEIEVSNEPLLQENGKTILSYTEPVKTKVFNPDKLPEPARTEYKEAMASMMEIENANSALAQKGGIKVNPIKNESARYSMFDHFDPSAFDGIGFKPAAKPEPTETQKSARAKLNEKVSSSGISYKDAKATIESITKQYKNNPDYQSEFAQEQPKDRYVYYLPIRAFDPYKLKGADREVYFKALSAIHEIETANYALLTQAGLSPTKDPQMPKDNREYFVDNR